MNSDVLQERLTRGLVLAFIFLAFLLVICSSPAQAGKRHDRRDTHDRYADSRGDRGHERDGDRRYDRYADSRRHRGHERDGDRRYDRRARPSYRNDRGRGHGYALGHRSAHRHVPSFRTAYRYSRSRPFVVPHRIVTAQVGAFRPYYAGRAYFPAHRHHHVVYRFPVYTHAGLIWRPHVYCGDRLFVSGDVGFRLGHMSIRLSF